MFVFCPPKKHATPERNSFQAAFKHGGWSAASVIQTDNKQVVVSLVNTKLSTTNS